MSSLVLDASIALAWLIDTSTAPYAMRVRQLLEGGSRAVVPTLWQWEIANGFVTAERRGMLSPSDTAEILQRFEIAYGEWIEISQSSVSTPQVVATARTCRLTAYDAAYITLAMEQQLPLATLDRRLAEAAKRVGVSLVH